MSLIEFLPVRHSERSFSEPAKKNGVEESRESGGNLRAQSIQCVPTVLAIL